MTSAQQSLDAARAEAAASRAEARKAQADRWKAEKDVERYRQLASKDEISRQQFDDSVAASQEAQAAAESAEALVRAANRQVAVAQGGLEEAKDKLAQAQAEVNGTRTAPQQIAASRAEASAAEAKTQEMQAALDQAELNLQYTTVRAPATGLVGQKHLEVGMNIQAGQPVLSLAPLEDIWVTANFKENQLRDVRPGQKARVSVDAYGRSYSAHVESIAAATGERYSLLPPENATGNYVKVVQRIPVRIRLDHGQDPHHLLRIGMSVTATIYMR